MALNMREKGLLESLCQELLDFSGGGIVSLNKIGNNLMLSNYFSALLIAVQVWIYSRF